MNVAILGASSNPDRYAYKAHSMLQQHGHTVLPVGRRDDMILGDKVYRSIMDITEAIDTVTLYVGPQHAKDLVQEIIEAKPRRIIFNPGTEDPAIISQIAEHGIQCEQACTLVLLSTGQF
ncbi:MAG: CoA-binding protein [Bdellovibrionales bacterium]|nr:CoA-binding protein [Bdellovibrionales bacterium]